jgi:Bax protein
MVGRFERAIPVAAAGLVLGMVGLAVFDPPAPHTQRPLAVLENPNSANGGELDGFDTAAGPALPAGLMRLNARGTAAESIIGGIDVKPRGQGASASSLHTAKALDDTFQRIGYDLDAVREGAQPVPRVFLASLPKDLSEVRQAPKRKEIFFRSVLPLVLQVNNEILADRQRLWRLHTETKKGRKLDAVDRLWLIVLAERYKVKRGNIKALLQRVDIVPPSMALAQAAEESGWGTSRFSRQGNAIFGEWTFSEADGLVPKERDEGKTHRVKVFKSLLHSVRAYARNLNTHRAYKEFRALRRDMRHEGAELSGRKLVETLTRYSERGPKYVKTLRSIMTVNKLNRLDAARLSAGSQAGRVASAI